MCTASAENANWLMHLKMVLDYFFNRVSRGIWRFIWNPAAAGGAANENSME